MSDKTKKLSRRAKIRKEGIAASAGILEGFRNYYHCPYDGASWTAEWSCQCNDRCPTCRAEIEPHDSEDIVFAQ
jgi:transcription initiation factor IIE alpha subunit